MLSVVICTRNPRLDFLNRVLKALEAQSLERSEWELLVVDNASTEAVAKQVDLAWHSQGRHLREEKLGLTNARIKGFTEAKGDWVILVDDDNILDADYLKTLAEKIRTHPFLGTIGGSIVGEYAEPLTPISRQYLNWLAVREIRTDLWSNLPWVSASHPYGAGMAVRRDVIDRYLALVQSDPLRSRLDRVGNRLWGGGDADMNYTATLMGLGNGVFKDLRLTHIMPPNRLKESYLLHLVEDMTCSSLVLHWLWGRDITLPSRSQRLYDWYRNRSINEQERRFCAAKARGLQAAHDFVADLTPEERSFPRPHFE
jgi:glycosyltransferase involved in cell wall biosynthesis